MLKKGQIVRFLGMGGDGVRPYDHVQVGTLGVITHSTRGLLPYRVRFYGESPFHNIDYPWFSQSQPLLIEKSTKSRSYLVSINEVELAF